MKSKAHIVLYMIAFPWNLLVAWPVVLLIRLFWGKGLRWETPPYAKDEGGGPVLTSQMKEGSWPVRPGGWYFRKASGKPWGGTTLGHGIFYGPFGRNETGWTTCQMHEHVHVEQFEAVMTASFLLGLIIFSATVWFNWVLALALWGGVWFVGYLMMGVGGWLAALLRGEQGYVGSQHEEAARGVTKVLWSEHGGDQK